LTTRTTTQRNEERKDSICFFALQTINLRARRAQTYRGRQNYGWQNYRSLGKRGILARVVLLSYDREENDRKLADRKMVSTRMAPCLRLHQEHLFVTNISVNSYVLVAADGRAALFVTLCCTHGRKLICAGHLSSLASDKVAASN
jgi:hypothetical protein